MQELFNTMKRPNLWIIGIEEGRESQVNGIDQFFNRIREENFPKKGRHIRSQQHHRQEQKRNSPQHIIAKTLNMQNKEKVLKATREKSQVTYESKPTRITADFSVETLKAKRA